jgi:hypothetical protein
MTSHATKLLNRGILLQVVQFIKRIESPITRRYCSTCTFLLLLLLHAMSQVQDGPEHPVGSPHGSWAT